MTGAVAQKENEQELPQGAMSPDDQLAAEWESSVEKEAQSITNEEVVEGETENLRVLSVRGSVKGLAHLKIALQPECPR